MKTNYITAVALGVMLINMPQISLKACADALPYEPVFESVPITEVMTTSAATESTTLSAAKVTPINTVSVPATTTQVTPISTVTTGVETENLQNALLQLDGAQVEIRNQLIQYKNEYADLDGQYRNLKEKRALKAKQIRETEKKIKNIDSIKEKTRKNMN